MAIHLSSIAMDHPTFAQSRWHDARWQHRQIMALFGDLGGNSGARTTGRILFRAEPDMPAHDGSPGRVLVQSSVLPEAEGVRSVDLTPTLERLRPELPVHFQLRANTVRTVNRTDADGNERKHRARIPEAELEVWLRDRLAGAVALDGHAAAVPADQRAGRAQLITTTFHARATVEDPERLREHIIGGVGRAKAYGCGLLSVLPIR